MEAPGEEILDFLKSQIFSDLSQEEKEKFSLYHSNGRSSDHRMLEGELLKKQLRTSILSVPKAVFIQNIINSSSLKGKELVSLCSSDPYIRDVCRWNEGALYRKLIERETGITPSPNLNFNQLSDLYMAINNGVLYYENSEKNGLVQIPGIKNVIDFIVVGGQDHRPSHNMCIDMKGDLYNFSLSGRTYFLNIGNLAKLFKGDGKIFCVDREGKFYQILLDLNVYITDPMLKPLNLSYDLAKIKEVFYVLDCICVVTIDGEFYYKRAPSFPGGKGFLKLDVPPVRKIVNMELYTSALNNKPLLIILTMDGMLYGTTTKYTVARIKEYPLDFPEYPNSKIIDVLFKENDILVLFENGDLYHIVIKNNIFRLRGKFEGDFKGMRKIYFMEDGLTKIYEQTFYFVTDKFKVFRFIIGRSPSGEPYFKELRLMENWNHFGKVLRGPPYMLLH